MTANNVVQDSLYIYIYHFAELTMNFATILTPTA